MVPIVITPAFAPAFAGVAVTVNVTFPPTGIVTGNDVGIFDKLNTAVPVVTLIELNDNAAVPLLLIVNEVNAGAAVPIGAVPTSTAVELLVMIAAPFFTCNDGVEAAWPVTSTFNKNEGVAGSFVVIVIVPGFEPTADGVPVTVNVAEPPAGIGPGIGVGNPVSLNMLPPVVTLIEVSVSGARPVLLTVNDVYAVAGEPTVADPTEIAVVGLVTIVVPFLTVSAGTVPVAVTFTLYEGVTASLDAIVITPAFAVPAVAGVAVTVNVAVAPAAIVVAVGMDSIKPAEIVDTTIFLSGARPVLVIVNVYGVAALPTAAVPTNIAGALLFCTVAGVASFMPITGTVPVILTLMV